MKKFLSVLTLLALVISLFSGCHGAQERIAYVTPEEFDTSRNYEITFWAKNDTNLTQTNIYKKAIEVGGSLGLGLGLGGSLGLGAAASGQAQNHDNSHQQCKDLLHLVFLLFSKFYIPFGFTEKNIIKMDVSFPQEF